MDEARGFLVEHAHYVEDLPFWRAAARVARGPVLELGCAAGRVTLALAQDGVQVSALDRSPRMLAELMAEAERRGVSERVSPTEADMRDFRLHERFALVIAPMNTLQVLLTAEDQLRGLRCARAHLASGGEFVFDVALPDLAEAGSLVGVVRHLSTHRDEESKTTLHQSAWYDDLDPLTQTLRFTIQVDRIGDDGSLHRDLRPHAVHLYHPTEIAHLLARAGLGIVEVHGDFRGGVLDPGAQHQVYRCRAE